MKAKKLIAFLLCFVIFFAGMPAITSSAAEVQSIGKWQRVYDTTNYTKKCYSTIFTLNEAGVVRFKASKLLDKNGNELLMTYNLYEMNGDDLGEKVWTVNTYKFEETTQDHQRLIGLASGEYVLEVSPSIYSSSFPASGTLTLYFSLDFIPFDCYETEANDTKETADTVYMNTPVYAYADNSEDFYCITVNKDTPARIKVKNYSKLSQAAYMRFYSAKNETQFLSSYNAGAGKGYYYFDVMLRAGKNYINVTSVSKAQIDYWFEVSSSIVVPTPVVNNLKISGTRVDVSWNQLSGISGFEIYRKINNGSWKLVLTGTNRTIGFYQTGTNFNYTYQFMVRAYKTIGDKKFYSKWSNIKALNPTPTNIKLSASAYTYTGKAKTPAVVVKNKNGKTLKKGTDYTVTYSSGRKNVGKYAVTIKFIGNYSGKKTVYFKILPKGTAISSVSAAKKSLYVKLKKQTSQTSGYQIQYSTSKKFTGAKTVTVKSSKTTSATLKSLKAKKAYYVRVRTYKTVGKNVYYSTWSKAVSKKTK